MRSFIYFFEKCVFFPPKIRGKGVDGIDCNCIINSNVFQSPGRVPIHELYLIRK